MNRPSGTDDGWSSPSYGSAGGGNRADTRVGADQPRRPAGRDDRRYDDRRYDDRRVSSPPPRGQRPQDARGRDNATRAQRPVAPDDGWSAAGPTSARDQRATRQAERRAELDARRTERSVDRLNQQTQPRPYERGYRWWLALVVLVAVTLLGALVDSVTNSDNQNGFNIAIVVASVLAILIVKRSQMFAIVVSPPIVYSFAALLQLYLRSSFTSDNKSAIQTILNAVQNYLVYGFPALATATAAVLIIAGIRLVSRK